MAAHYSNSNNATHTNFHKHRHSLINIYTTMKFENNIYYQNKIIALQFFFQGTKDIIILYQYYCFTFFF